jgi:peptidoglycan/LPS O-acetylase OafA/YrhL
MNSGKRQLLPLTGMRCFLALWVVVYHQIPAVHTLAIDWFPNAPDIVPCLIRTGYVAVSVFFVLSGFVLSYNYDLGKRWPPSAVWRFAAARFARVYPAYFLGILLILPFMLLRAAKGVTDLATQAFFGLLSVMLLQSWNPWAALTWNYPGWSLSNEVFFYSMFPFAGVLLWRLKRPGSLTIGLLSLWALSLVAPLWSVAAHVHSFGDAPATAHTMDPSVGPLANFVKYNPLLRIPEFFAGILLGRIYILIEAITPRWIGRGYWLYLPGMLLAGAALANADRIPLPLINSGLLLPFYACIILGLALDGGIVARFLSTGPLVFLGNASYSMYILHVPLSLFLMVFVKHILALVPAGLGWVGVYSGTVVAVSCVVYKFVEEPANRYLKGKLIRRPPTAMATTA